MSQPAPITFREGTPDDAYDTFLIFEAALADLIKRLGSREATSIADPDALAAMWDERRSLYEHLSRTAAHFWLAERDGQAVGFARSVRRGDSYQLTELFVDPGQQSGGVGRELLARAFPPSDAPLKSVIASVDYRAQGLYLRQGVLPRFLVYYFGRQPERVPVETDLVFEPIGDSLETLETLAALDANVLTHRRDADHRWLLTERQGILYRRAGRPVGYGYLGVRNGPFALLEAADFPAALAHAENAAAEAGRDHFGVEVPTINQTAVTHLLARDFTLDAFVAVFMSSRPYGRFENYILTSPPFLI